MKPLIALTLALTGVLSPTVTPAQGVGPRPQVLVGRVTTDGGRPIASADVFITVAADLSVVRGVTDVEGTFVVRVAHGTGDFLVHVAAAGFNAVRKRITSTSDSIAVGDMRLSPSLPPTLAPVRVRAVASRPQRGLDPWPEPGAAEGPPQGMIGAVSPENAGDLASLAATTPGIMPVTGGVSAFGLGIDQTSTTLNGFAFAGADIPRDAPTRTRISTSTFDPARGWFGGTQVGVDLLGGGVLSSRTAHATIDAPLLQLVDPIAAQLGQRVTSGSVSVGGSGPLTESDRLFHSYGLQGGRVVSHPVSLLEADDEFFNHAGVAIDSARRLVAVLRHVGVPLNEGSSARVTENVSFIGRLDHAPYDWQTFAPPTAATTLTVYGKWTRSRGVGVTGTSPLAHASDAMRAIGSVQGSYSRYLQRGVLAELRSALSLMQLRSTPFTSMPEGQVSLQSTLADGDGASTTMRFGGSPSGASDERQMTWETTANLQLIRASSSAHRVTLAADSRLDRYSQQSGLGGFGSFIFASLSDVEQNMPSTFLRTVSRPRETGTAWNAFASIGDLWRASNRLQVMYGARVEGTAFLDAPSFNATLWRALGTRNDHVPNSVHISPRFGFTWMRDDASIGNRSGDLGRFAWSTASFLRGGIGEFRSFTPATLLAGARSSSGLAGERETITCVGGAAPRPRWSEYVGNPGAIPSACINATGLSDRSLPVQLIDEAYATPHSWRANLAYSSQVRALVYSIEGTYSLNVEQPGSRDLNLVAQPRFVLADEGGRPVFVSPAAIDPASGRLSTPSARREAAFGRVVDHTSDARSVSRQVTFVLRPDLSRLGAGYISFAYTLADVRARARGFDAPTFGGPDVMEWSRGDLDTRHQLLFSAGYSGNVVSATLQMRASSGMPFTPLIGTDVNGDGLANDRAFIVDPSRASDQELARGMSELLRSASSNVRSCLQRQLGTAAGRASCESPWAASANAQLSLSGRAFGFRRLNMVSLNLTNPLAGLDYALHGANALRGWGVIAQPDPVLYTARSFQSDHDRFVYVVNPRFGTTTAARSTVRSPFRLTLDASFALGPSVPEQQLDRWLRPGRGGRPGSRLSSTDLRRRYARTVPDPYDAVLQEDDSLLLTRAQFDDIQAVRQRYRTRIDSLWNRLAVAFAAASDDLDVATLLARQNTATDEAWELTRLDVRATLPTVLSPQQLRMLPTTAAMFLNAREPIRGIRMSMDSRP